MQPGRHLYLDVATAGGVLGQNEAHRAPESERAALPDSIILQRGDGRLLDSSTAIVHLLIGLGGMWGLLGRGLRIVPSVFRDLVYRGVAALRKRIFAKPAGLCPMLPPHLGERFLP